MLPTRSDIISRLRQEINQLNGFRNARGQPGDHSLFHPLSEAFPGGRFPLHTLHELICEKRAHRAAGIAFISVVLSTLLERGIVAWISEKPGVFPNALASYGMNPSQFIFIRCKNVKEKFWTIEESIKCKGLSAVIGEIQQADFNFTRRLQLATETTGVTCFLFNEKNSSHATASTARWRITPLPSVTIEDFPGVGYPAWQVDLLRLKNGKSRSWKLFLKDGTLELMPGVQNFTTQEHRKTG